MIGKFEIKEKEIIVKDYLFEPSKVYPNKIILFSEIEEIYLDTFPITLKYKNDLIFISKEKQKEMEIFVENNHIKKATRKINWDFITEPFLDTSFTKEEELRTLKILAENGISENEVKILRKEISKPMYKYNFATMLWEWVSLSLLDVLCAMKAKYKKEAFETFYWKALEIEQRNKI
ncbi:MAG: hypothetical protein U0457_19845 [Candidatus Sericytochromatia bacterium]